MKKILSITAIVLVVAAIFMAIFFDTRARPKSGTTGDCRWRLKGSTLIISGNGKMKDIEEEGEDGWFYEQDNIIYDTGFSDEDGDDNFSNEDDSDFNSLWSDKIEKVVIKKGVTHIGDRAFSGCSKIISVTIADTVETIGYYAFSGCESLESITLPESVTDIDSGAFSYCTNLKDISIPNCVTSIGGDAFSNCESLESITLPNSVTEIGSYAFRGCSNLKNISLPNGVTKIGGSAFSNCESLKSISIPNSVTNIGEYAFLNCESLENISLPNGVTNIGESAFVGCTSLKSVTIPNGVKIIPENAFSNCTSLEKVTIPNSVTTIDFSAFWHCEKLVNVKMSNGITNIEESAFQGCKELASIKIPNSVKKIGIYAFSGCEKLANIEISDAVVSMGYGAFENTKFYDDPKNWENGALYIGKYLIDFKKIFPAEYKIKNGTKIIRGSLEGLNNLSTITIPASVIDFPEAGFANHWSLESIIIDKNNPNYSSEDGVVFNKDKTKIYGFPAYKKSTSYIIPSSVTTISGGAFANEKYLTSITIPSSVTTIEENAFEDSNIKDVYYFGSALERTRRNFDNVLTYANWHYNQKCNHVYDNHICKKCYNYDSDKPLLHKGQDGKYYYYDDGVKRNNTTLATINGKRHYIKNGVWMKNATGVYKIASEGVKRWYYIEDGVTKRITKLFKKKDETLLIQDGRWHPTQDTIYEFDGKDYSFKSGRWCKDEMILCDHYCKDGFAQVDFTGDVEVDGVLYAVVNGRVLYSYN